jgi:hypothetical protein
MKATHTIALFLVLISAAAAGIAQPGKSGSTAVAASRYFQITLSLKFVQAADQQPATETITTQVAVRDGKPGSCKARMLSQVPAGAGAAMKYIELGTKLDCNDVCVEGDGIALDFALETSGYMGSAKTKGSDGVIFAEPMIAQRSVQLSVKLPLDQPKVVFDSSAHPLKPLSPPTLSADPSAGVVVSAMPVSSRLGAPMLIEMTATELK